MRIGIDLDGVVYDYEAAIRHYLVNHEGYDDARLPRIEGWHLWQQWGFEDAATFWAIADKAVEDGILFRWGLPCDDTVGDLQRLVDAGHTLHVITARKCVYSGLAEGATMEWITQHLPPVESVTFSADKTIVRTDAMIEDNLDNYDALYKAGTRAYLIDRPWNTQENEWPWRRRVANIAEFVNAILPTQAVA